MNARTLKDEYVYKILMKQEPMIGIKLATTSSNSQYSTEKFANEESGTALVMKSTQVFVKQKANNVATQACSS